ncbi:CopD family protein [Jeongeupia sp. HS-3]|uniref:CopD family protein n=1 Tax=Jeongeupia sp. HS-3 TaxID=1009682 RepID=UPI00190FEA4C|nr:CopD family protein [Jeongeupia sp. HS-3]
MPLESLLSFLHIASVTIWVGGMFFAYACLRPAAAALLEPAQRLRLWRAVFGRFFVWVWIAIALILASGLAMLLQLGFAAAPRNWHLMLTSGLVMIAIFAYVYAGPYAALVRAVEAEDWKAGGAALGRIRQAVGINLALGVLTIAVATLGRLIA